VVPGDRIALVSENRPEWTVAYFAVTAAGRQIRERDGGNGFAAQSDPRLHFGLGREDRIALMEVRWPDGTTVTVPLLSAEQAVAAFWTGVAAPCGDCASLWITEWELTSKSIQTTRGPAAAPTWEFSLKGTAVKVTRVAVADPVTVEPRPWDPNVSPLGLRIDSASGMVSGSELTVAFVGAPFPGDQPCGEDYATEAVESDLAVVVLVFRHPHLTLGGCSAVGARRTATVKLASPLGERAVLEVQQGLPVPVALTP